MGSHTATLPLPRNVVRFLGRTHRRMRLQRALVGAGYGLAGGVALGVVAGLIARLFPIVAPGLLPPLLLGGLALAGLLGTLIAALRPLPLGDVAARCDRELGLRERLSTALELANGAARSRLAPQQVAETAGLLAGRDPSALALPQPERRATLVVAGLVAALFVLLLAPNPQDAVIRQRLAERQLTEEAARRVEAIQAGVANNPSLDPATRAALEQQLADLRRDLASGEIDRNATVGRIAETEAQLRQLQDPAAGREAAGLPRLAEEFGTIGATAEIGRRLATGDYSGAGAALRDLGPALPGLDPASRAALAAKLRAAAASQAATNPRLAGQLQDAADAIDRGDLPAAAAALDAAGAEVASAGERAATQEQLAQTLGEIGAVKRDVANGQTPGTAGATPQRVTGSPIAGGGTPVRPSGSPVTLNGTPIAINGTPIVFNAQGTPTLNGTPVRIGPGGTPVAGTGGTPVIVPAQGQGGQPAQGQGSQPGQGQGQGQPGGQGQGQGQGQTPGGQSGSGAGTGSGSYDPVYAPSFPGGPAGQQQQVPGSGGEGAPPSGTTQGPGANAPASVPYNQVYEEYRDAALRALDDPTIPPELREYIRQYFSDIDPNKK